MADARDIFVSARAIPTTVERDAYLERACGADAGLRNKVEQLLAADAEAGEFLAETPELAAAVERAGQRIGRYRLLHVLGEGGFGTVWRAEQLEPVRREVALKIIKLGMDTRQVIARFEVERQALAMMDHPGIAKVLDAGCNQERELGRFRALVRNDAADCLLDEPAGP